MHLSGYDDWITREPPGEYDVGVIRCGRCKGAGEIRIGGVELECPSCKGRGEVCENCGGDGCRYCDVDLRDG